MNSTLNPPDLALYIGTWLRKQVTLAGAEGIVVGLSGGVDSALVAALGVRVFGRSLMAVVMPCHSDPGDASDALLVADKLNIPFVTVDLTSSYDCLVNETEISTPLSSMAKANIKARLRMTTLYGIAQSLGYLVCGTSNRAEREIGYFTKFGDSASDLLPIAGLLKREVRQLALYLGVPEAIVHKPPTAGLWAGQTDEGEMGFSYDDLDTYLATGEGTVELCKKIEHMRKNSEHKRCPVPICELRECQSR